jgi:hypothetical protein
VLNRVLDRALPIGIADAGRISDRPVVREHGSVDTIDLGLVEIGRDDAFLEIVENDVTAAAAKIAKGLLMQPCPDLLARLPDHATEAAPGVTQRHDEQPRPAVATRLGLARERALAVVDLRLFAGRKRQAIELLGVHTPQGAYKALDAVLSTCRPAAEHVAMAA